jgi:hypothetical protein
MTNIAPIRWATVGLHVIVLIFGVVVGVATIGLDPSEAIRAAEADPNFKRVLFLVSIVVGGNLLGALLLLTRLFTSSAGLRWILGYEIIFLIISITFLSIEYTIAIGVIVAALLYAVFLQTRSRSTPT